MKNKHCNECGILVECDGKVCEGYNIDIDDNVICGECGVQSHCFCDECGEYVPTSHCIVGDIKTEVASATIDETKVICNVCDAVGDELKNRYKDDK